MSTTNDAMHVPAWFKGPAEVWAALLALAEAMLAKERQRRRRLAAGLLSSAGLILLCGTGLSQTVMAQGAPHAATPLTTAILMMIAFVVVGGFQTLRYLEQHALDVSTESQFLERARQALRDRQIDPAPQPSEGTPAERLIRREAWKIHKAEESARRLAPALWGTGLTDTAARRAPH